MGVEQWLHSYQCHKVVKAARITEVEGNALTLENTTHVAVEVIKSKAWMEHHKPEVGGYYVIYENGYDSYSPAEPFEKGYTKL